ncbi:MAG: EF-P beta-lysylation protein EpmB [Pseudomonadota bacterium]
MQKTYTRMQPQSWQNQLASAIKNPRELLNHVGLDANSLGYTQTGIKQFPVRVPLAFASRMQQKNPDDPLLRQVFPYLDEDRVDPAYTFDPLEEKQSLVGPGLLHKYHDRVLMISTSACAIHCRYCFRRHFPYEENRQSKLEWQQRYDYIKSNSDINEVILSGGDPLSLADHKLTDYLHTICQIKHVKRIRIHTRFPIVIPDRITQSLFKTLKRTNKEIIFVLHINHANEIDENVSNSIALMNKLGIMVLNQSVLLKGVNDTTDCLIALSEKLIENRVTPYYLHMLDPVAGTTHFNVSEDEAINLIKTMQNKVSGYLIPKLVRENSDEKSKTAINLD